MVDSLPVMGASDQPSGGLRHLRGNAEAVLVMTQELLERHQDRIDAQERAFIADAVNRLKQAAAGGSEEVLRRALEEFDRISLRLAQLVEGRR
ncbi:MAG: hypothetical protein HY901_31360 [Deltaproteobacteria bacterium]|nr:hypothetical protein [Deltaproteobacteria bacterium]